MKKITVLLSVAAIFSPTLAFGSEHDAPMSATNYVTFNTAQYSVCRMLVGLKAELGQKETVCPKEVASTVKGNYPAAVKLAKKNREVIGLLKQYREAVLNGLAGIQPLIDERKISYSMRQDQAEAEITQLSNRIEMAE